MDMQVAQGEIREEKEKGKEGNRSILGEREKKEEEEEAGRMILRIPTAFCSALLRFVARPKTHA